MSGYLRLELARTLRDGRYLVLGICAPVGFYLLFASVFGGRSSGSNGTFGLPASIEIMVAMATFGAMWGALSATAPRLARDREGGWLAYLDTTPLHPARVLSARIVAGLAVALPAIVAVGATAALTHDVHLAAWQWAGGLGLLWAGTAPFVALGIAIGSLTSSTVAYALSTGLYFALAALGGLWVPPGVLSPGLREVAMALPSYNEAALGWHVASGGAPTLTNGLVLAAWTVGLTLLPLAAHSRRRRSSPPPAGADPTEAIRLSRLSRRFGTNTALDGIELAVSHGEAIALLGPNGSGKTTTIGILLGLIDASGGWARLFGGPARRATRSGEVGAMLQDTELMTGVLVGELIGAIRAVYPNPADLAELIEMAGLSELLRQRTDRLSAGQAQRVRFALAAAGDPRLLVLDEPTAAMDVQAQRAFWAALRRLRAGGTTVLFSTHNLQEAEQNAGRVVLIRSGQIVADGTPEQVKAAAGAGRVVSFRLLGGRTDRFDDLPGVTKVQAGDGSMTLETRDGDATLWALYELRHDVADVVVTDGVWRRPSYG